VRSRKHLNRQSPEEDKWRAATAKSNKGNRIATLSTSIQDDLHAWHAVTPNIKPEDWIFASENGKTPLWPTNVWHDKIRPTLDTLGLSWVNYQVLRRSVASLMNQLGIEAKTVADQLGQTLDVSQNVYTQAGVDKQRQAIEKLDNALES
jgi:integrase